MEGGSAQAGSGGKQVRRSTLAVAAGFVLAPFLSRSVDVLLERTGVFPTVAQQQADGFDVLWMNVVALCYRNRPARHVHILGLIATAVAAIANVAVAMTPATANVLPAWFSVALVLMAYPTAWLGGRLYLRH